MTEPLNFQTLADIDAYVTEHGKVKLLRLAIEGPMHPANRRAVDAWLWLQELTDKERSALADVEISRRQMTTGQYSQRLAILAIVISLVSLFVSALPLMGR